MRKWVGDERKWRGDEIVGDMKATWCSRWNSEMKGDRVCEKMMYWIRWDGMWLNEIVWDLKATQGSRGCGEIW